MQANRAGSTANNIAQGPCIAFSDSTAGTSSLVQHSGGQTEFWQYNSAWHQIFYVNVNRTVVINSPISGVPALQITASSGSINSCALSVTSGSTAGSPGIIIIGGASSGSTGIFFEGVGTSASVFQFGTGWYGTGSATPTLSANKPGSNSGVSGWLQCLNASGTTVYIPFWT